MEDLVFEKELDIECMKCENAFKSTSSVFLMNIVEASSTASPYVFYEASIESLKDAALDILKNITEAIKTFFKEASVFIETKARQFDLNNKLKELKSVMAKTRSDIVNKRYNYFDVKKYKKYYDDFIDTYTAELTKGLNKNFSSVEEYEKWRNDMEAKLNKFNTLLSDEEQWRLEVAIHNAVELTETEAKNRQRNLEIVRAKGSNAIKKLEDYYSKLDSSNPYNKYNLDKTKAKIASSQTSFIGFVCSKLLQCTKTIIKFITKHTFLTVTALLVILIAK